MSKSSFAAVCALAAVVSTSTASASTPAPDDGYIPHYALNSENLDAWHGGVHGFASKRNVENKRTGRLSEMDARRANAYLGYDLTRWMTVYGLCGVLSVKDTGERLESDTEVAYGAGVWFNLLDDDQLDFLGTISRYRLTAGLEVSHGDPNDLSWTQYDGYATFEILNDMYLADEMFPTQVGVFAGPVFSSVELDGWKQSGDNDWGFRAGLDMRFANGVFVKGAYDWFTDDSIASFTAGIRF